MPKIPLPLIEGRYPFIPLKGKIPAVRNWTTTPPADAARISEIEKGNSNYGVVLSAGDLVVDVDPRNFSPGDKPLARLVAAIGAPLSSFTVRTGGGGLHIYFKKPSTSLCAHTLKEYPGLEFKSAGRQVVGPGSVHPESGKTYDVVVDKPISSAPQALLDLLKISAVPYSEIEKEKRGKGHENATYKNDAETQGRFVEYLRAVAPPSVEGKGGDATAFKVACHGRDLGLPPANTLALMGDHWNPRCLPPWEDAELEAKVINAYKYAKGDAGGDHPSASFSPVAAPSDGRSDSGVSKGQKDGGNGVGADPITWETTAQGAVKKSFHNLMNYLRLPAGGLYKVFGYNEFTGQVEFINPAPWHKGIMPRAGGIIQDNDLKLLKGHLVSKFGFEMAIGTIEEAVTVTAHNNKFHPVREYLESLRGQWDGKERLSTWLTDYCGVVDTQYARAAGRKMICAAVARVMQPGCVFHHVLVLEGGQGIGKSQLVKALGGKWAGDFTIDPHNKDTVDSMQGKWFVELAEMSVLRRTEMAALKAFISRDSDRVRQAYGRLTREFPRQCVFIGTINPEADMTYLTDSTGNRRFWPIECGERINFKKIAEDRNKLFAEALMLVEAKKENLYMDNIDLDTAQREEAGKRHAVEPWTERIAAWLNDPVIGAGSGAGRDFVTPREVFLDAIGGTDRNLERRDIIKISNVMRSLGWVSCVQRKGTVVIRGYESPEFHARRIKGETDKRRKSVVEHLSRGGEGASAADNSAAAKKMEDDLDGLI